MSDDAGIAEAIQRYLRSGEYEHDHPEWPGQNVFEKARRGHDDLLDALVREVQRRAGGRRHTPVPTDLDLVAWTRRKVTPMVEGLFPAVEREAILKLLEKSVVFLTADNIERVLREQRCLHSAWDLANLYLSSVDAELLGPKAPSLLGLSQETTCYVSADYFADVENGRFADYVIHEAAHEQLVVPLASSEAVARCQPDPPLLKRHGSNATRQGLAYVWARDSGGDVAARFFFLKHGAVVEDPGTGSACANLGGWRVASGASLPIDLVVRQGEKTGRRCRLRLRIDAAKRILVSGRVVEVGRGEIDVLGP